MLSRIKGEKRGKRRLFKNSGLKKGIRMGSFKNQGVEKGVPTKIRSGQKGTVSRIRIKEANDVRVRLKDSAVFLGLKGPLINQSFHF